MLPAFSIATLFAWGVLISTFTHPGWIGLNHVAPGTDWMVFYGAVKSSLAGNLALVTDGDAFTAYLNQSFASWLTVPLEFRPWFYPPGFLVLLLPFAPLGFIGSYVAFQAATAGFLAWALRNRSDQPQLTPYIIAAVLVSPSASLNLADGQCAFLVAALLVAGVRLLGPRPLLAGAILGLLSFKPQFFLLVPLALMGARRYGSLCAAACSAFALAAASAMILWRRIVALVDTAGVQQSGQPRREMAGLWPHLGSQRVGLRDAARPAGAAGLHPAAGRDPFERGGNVRGLSLLAPYQQQADRTACGNRAGSPAFGPL
ncbi:hypothetical protein ACVWZL_006114 [Bradyrhizobium sp. GM2.4]